MHVYAVNGSLYIDHLYCLSVTVSTPVDVVHYSFYIKSSIYVVFINIACLCKLCVYVCFIFVRISCIYVCMIFVCVCYCYVLVSVCVVFVCV